MTRLAIGGETRLLVVRVRCRLVVRKMTACACRRCPRVLTVRMTKSAVGDRMLAVQRKDQAVIERRPLPTTSRCTMTGLAVSRETGLLVIRIGRALIIRQVTPRTGRRCSRVLTIGMT